MSFLKKLTKEFEGLMGDEKKGDQKNGAYPQAQSGGDHPHAQQQGYQQYGQQAQAFPPTQYGQSQQPMYQAPYHQTQHQGPPAHAGYGASGNGGSIVPPLPHMPPGWAALWDPVTQHWAWLEHATSMVNWNGPGGNGPSHGYSQGGGMHDANRGAGASMPFVEAGKDKSKEGGKDKSKDKKKMLMGLAAGGVGGALLANAFDGNDNHGGATGGYGGHGGGYGHVEQGYSSQAPMYGQELPDETRSGSSVSSSDKEDVEEARKEYEEARQEYEEAYEETYDE